MGSPHTLGIDVVGFVSVVVTLWGAACQCGSSNAALLTCSSFLTLPLSFISHFIGFYALYAPNYKNMLLIYFNVKFGSYYFDLYFYQLVFSISSFNIGLVEN
jgi:hypothetical protein